MSRMNHVSRLLEGLRYRSTAESLRRRRDRQYETLEKRPDAGTWWLIGADRPWTWWPKYYERLGVRDMIVPSRKIWALRYVWHCDEPRIGYGPLFALDDWLLTLTGPIGVLRGLLRWRRR